MIMPFFYECCKLKDITMPEKLKTIGKRAFYGCKELSKIEIPNNVNYIDFYAFMNLYLNGYKQPVISNTNYL